MSFLQACVGLVGYLQVTTCGWYGLVYTMPAGRNQFGGTPLYCQWSQAARPTNWSDLIDLGYFILEVQQVLLSNNCESEL